MASIAELKALARQKLRERGMEWFWPAMDFIYTRESNWNPQAHNTRGEDSVGLGQMNRAGGMGTGYSVEQLMDPSFNMDLMLDHVQKALAGGATLQQALQPWTTTHGVDAASLVSGQATSPQGGETMTDPTLAKYVWIEEQGWAGEAWHDPDYPNISLVGEAGKEYYKGLTASDRKAIDAAYLAATGQGAASEPMSAYESWSASHQTQEDELDRAQKVIEMGIDAGAWDAEQAAGLWKDMQAAIQNRMNEAGARGQYVSGVMEDRAKLMTPTEDFPGFEAGGLASQIMGRRGLTAPTLKGTPTSALPDPWEAFRQGNVSVGLPAEAEGIPAYPQATNPYAAALPGMESLAGGFNPWEAFQSGASGGASVPYTGASADVTAATRPQPKRYGPDLAAWLEQFGIRLPGL